MEPEITEGSGRLAVIGGTFDPVHYGHLMIAEDVRLRLGLQRVLFMPAGEPPHKTSRVITPARDRYLMAVLATAGNPHFQVSRREIDRPGISFTIDTVRELNEELGDDAPVYFVTGADSILEMDTWREPDAVLTEAQVVAVPRPGFDLALLEQTLGAERAARVTVIQSPAVDISSTLIRARIAAGESARYLCPRPVLDYIHKTGLYRPNGRGGEPCAR